MIRVDCGSCWLCGKASFIETDDPELAHAVLDWSESDPKTRPYIQVAFPQLTPGQRETIMSSTHEACFDAAFPAGGI